MTFKEEFEVAGEKAKFLVTLEQADAEIATLRARAESAEADAKEWKQMLDEAVDALAKRKVALETARVVLEEIQTISRCEYEQGVVRSKYDFEIVKALAQIGAEGTGPIHDPAARKFSECPGCIAEREGK